MERRSDRESSDSRGGTKPRGKSSWSKFYNSCFAQRKPFPQPISEASRNLPDQHSPTSSGHLGEASTSDHQQGDIRRPDDGLQRHTHDARTTRETGHADTTQEKLSIKQLVNDRLKELEETSGQTDRLLSELKKACDELRGPNDIDQLADKIVNVSNAVSTEICERSQTLQSAYKKFERDGEGLEEIGRYSQEVHKRVQQTIGERFLRLQDDCNELRETKDLLKTLRDFPHVWKQIDEAKADLSKATEENTKIKELSNRIIEKVENSRNKLHDKIINVSESNIKEFLDNSWRLQGAWDKLKEDVNQLETLRKASREWKEARQIKEEFIGTLSEKYKGAAGMRTEMANTAFEQFLSYFEQKDTKQGDKARLEKACEQLKSLVKADLYDKWYELANFRNKNHMQRQVPTEISYEQLRSSVEKGDFAQARKHIGQLAENILKSYEFKNKEVKLSRRTEVVDSLRALLNMRKEHRPERVKNIANEFNNTLGEMKGKLAAVPEEVKGKLVETTIAIMKDFKESYDDAIRGYGKRKGRETRERGERKITKLHDQFKTLNDAVSTYKQLHEVQAKDIEDLRYSYKERANKIVKDADHAFMQKLNRGGDWQSLKERIESAYGDLTDIVEPKIKHNSEKVFEKDMHVESLVITKKGDIEEIASATRGEHSPNEDSCFIFEGGAGVFDGVGEGGRGAEASRMAKGIFERKLSELSDKIKSGEVQKEHIKDVLNQITFDANNKMYNELNNEVQLKNNNDQKAMTTLSAVISIGDGKMAAVNIGDSRVYVLTGDGHLKHITKDDSPLSYDKEDIRAMQQEIYPFANVLANHIEGDKLSEGEQKEIQEKIAKMSDDDMKGFKTKIQLNYDTAKAKYGEINTVDTDTGLMNINKDWDTIVNEELIDKGKLSLEEIKMGLVIRHGRYIGNSLGDVDTEPNIVTFDVNLGDRVIITSDGVHDNLSDQDIKDCMSQYATAEKAAQALVKTAIEKSLDETRSRRKPDDDTTAVVIECSGEVGNNAQPSDRVTVQPQTEHQRAEASTSRGQGTPSEIEEVETDQR